MQHKSQPEAIAANEPSAPRDWTHKRASRFQKSVCLLISAAILNSLCLPLVHARIAQRNQQAQEEVWRGQSDPAASYAAALDRLDQLLTPPTTAAAATARGASAAPALAPLKTQLEQQAQTLRQQWQTLRATWQKARVAPEILARQQQTENAFEAKHRQLLQRLQTAINNPQNAAARADLQTFVRAEKPAGSHLPVDLQNLPWQVERPKTRLPATTAEQLQTTLATAAATPTLQTRVLARGNLPSAAAPAAKPVTQRQAIALENLAADGQVCKTIMQPGCSAASRKNATAAATTTRQTTTPAAASTQKAAPLAANAPRLVQKATAPTAAELAATLDAPQTAEIKALAASLNNNPHKIYQWVHDNIHYFPSHGSVQGAQDTLDKKRGNAFDTNSLLIALLRSAGIPARYVYGTIELPVEQVQNWVGGAATADAAQQLLNQGGIPNTILTKGGKDFAFRMEHVWVEAYIQYHPGRGATHVPGKSQPDTWLPMDGSYKQYSFSQGMDLQTAVPLDADALLTAAQQGAQINQAEGWVKNINTAALESKLKAWQTQLQNHINSQNGGKSTVGDVLGVKKPKIDPLPYLAASPAYTIKLRGQTFAQVPDSLRAKFRYEIYFDRRTASWGDSPMLTWQTPTAAIAGKKVTIAWVAATTADENAIKALIPTPPAGQELDPSQLPTDLSSSIHLKPEIRLDGITVATGGALNAGAEPIGAGSFTRYGSNQWDTTTEQLIAGQQTALGISIQGISQKQLETLKARMEATKAKLEQAQAAPQNQRESILQGLTGEHLTGDMLTATVWGYFASLQSYGAIAGSQADVIDLPALSYGLFHAQVKPRKLYGIVTNGIKFQGLNMDVGHLRSIRWVKDDNPQSKINSDPQLTANGKTAAQNRWIAYNKAKGKYSSTLEYVAPEQFWVNMNQCKYVDKNGQIQNPTLQACAEGISAVKAIAIAQQQSQKIYTINKENRDTALPKLTIGGAVGDEIRNAINAGKEVIFHENAISAHGWSGYGYIILDPETGVGAYLINGGGNGGDLLGILYATGISLLIAATLGYQVMLAFTLLSLFITPIGAAIVALILSSTLLYLSAEIFLDDSPCAQAIFQSISGVMLSLLPFGAAARTAAASEAVAAASLEGAGKGLVLATAVGIGACSL